MTRDVLLLSLPLRTGDLVFLKRISNNAFKESGPGGISSARVVSLRECIFYLGLLAAKYALQYWPKRSGGSLVSRTPAMGVMIDFL